MKQSVRKLISGIIHIKEEFLDEFSLDKKFISAYASFITGAPADKDIFCLEDCELLILGYSNLQ